MGAIPNSRAVGRGNHPTHVAKAPLKEVQGVAQNLMLRLKPGNIASDPIFANGLVESQESLHFVLVLPDGLRPQSRRTNIRISVIFQQCAILVHNTPSESVHEIPAPSVAITRQRL